jgi:Sigma-70 factor, region 1.2
MGLDAGNFVSKLGSCPQWAEIMGRLATADWSVTAESGLTRYLREIRRFPMMEPHEEYVLAKRWREHGDHEAAHKLVNSHVREILDEAAHRGSSARASDTDPLASSGRLARLSASRG